MGPSVTISRPGAALSTLAVAGAATLVVLVNYTAPASTVPPIAASFGAGVTGQTWILGSINLGLSALLLVAGTLADDLGRRRTFALGAGLLVLASLVCAAAPDTLVFALGRVLQGGASAALIAASLGLIAHAHPDGHERTKATAIWGAMVGLGIAVGPVFAALMTSAVGWRSTYLAVAVLSLLLVLAARGLAESRRDTPRAVDVAGVLTLGGGVAALVAALTQARNGWGHPSVLVFLVLAALLLVSFVLAERRGAEPMLDLGLLRRPLFLAATLGALATGVSVIGFMTYIATLAQHVYGLGALAASCLLAVWSGLSFVVALQVRRLRIDARRQLAVSLALCGAGELTMLLHHSWWQLIPGLALAGVGSGIGNAALGRLAVSSVPADRGGMGSGANNTARYLGAALGVAALGVVLGMAHSPAAGLSHAAVVAAALAGIGALAVALVR